MPGTFKHGSSLSWSRASHHSRSNTVASPACLPTGSSPGRTGSLLPAEPGPHGRSLSHSAFTGVQGLVFSLCPLLLDVCCSDVLLFGLLRGSRVSSLSSRHTSTHPCSWGFHQPESTNAKAVACFGKALILYADPHHVDSRRGRSCTPPDCRPTRPQLPLGCVIQHNHCNQASKASVLTVENTDLDTSCKSVRVDRWTLLAGLLASLDITVQCKHGHICATIE
jgi:hypothetical protein